MGKLFLHVMTITLLYGRASCFFMWWPLPYYMGKLFLHVMTITLLYGQAVSSITWQASCFFIWWPLPYYVGKLLLHVMTITLLYGQAASSCDDHYLTIWASCFFMWWPLPYYIVGHEPIEHVCLRVLVHPAHTWLLRKTLIYSVILQLELNYEVYHNDYYYNKTHNKTMLVRDIKSTASKYIVQWRSHTHRTAPTSILFKQLVMLKGGKDPTTFITQL
jgi:hypothetical protein